MSMATNHRTWALVGLAAVWGYNLSYGLITEARAASTSVRSFVCNNYAPGHPTRVTLQVTPDAGTQVWAAEESPPADFAVSNISDGGTFDTVNRKVKWWFLDGTPRALSYDVTPPAGASGVRSFSGKASFDGTNVTTTGVSSLSPDITPPSITCPPDPAPIAAGANCQAQVPNLVSGATATDNCDSSVAIAQNPVAGTLVGLGSTVVTLIATDDAGNTNTCTVTIRVVDAAPPVITCPPTPPPIAAGANCQAQVPNLVSGATATDNCDPNLTITQNPAAGAIIGLGNTVVTLTATDDAGNIDTCTVTVTVTNSAPVIDQGNGPLTMSLPVNSACPAADGAANRLLLSATDPNQGTSGLAWSVKTTPVSGTVSFVGGQTGGTIVLCYQPNTGFIGSDQFTIRVADPCGAADEVIVNVTVTSIPHPADGDSNWRIVIDEVTAYGACWKNGGTCTWPVPPNPVPIDYVTRAGYLWSVGETYHYETGLVPPDCWKSGVSASTGPTSKGPENTETTALTATSALTGSAPAAADPVVLSSALRTIEADAAVAGRFRVRVDATLPTAAAAWAVEDAVPTAWEVSDINETGVFDATTGKVKWGPFFDTATHSLTYFVRGPDNGQGTFAGVISVDGRSKSIEGDVAVEVTTPAPPARPFFLFPWCGSGIAEAFACIAVTMLVVPRRKPHRP